MQVGSGATGAATAEYVALEGKPLAYIATGAIYWVHADHLGTPQMLTDAAGAAVWDAIYRPFGAATITGAPAFNLRFPGQYEDAETGLHYNYFRDYDPATGRYIQSDPIGLGGEWNTYAYVGGSPIVSIDPLGLLTQNEIDDVGDLVQDREILNHPSTYYWYEGYRILRDVQERGHRKMSEQERAEFSASNVGAYWAGRIYVNKDYYKASKEFTCDLAKDLYDTITHETLHRTGDLSFFQAGWSEQRISSEANRRTKLAKDSIEDRFAAICCGDPCKEP